MTLVPDAPDAITSNAGWDTLKHKDYLKEIITEFKRHGIRTSIFVDPEENMIEGAVHTNTDRIELYTEDYAKQYPTNPEAAVAAYIKCATLADNLGLGINAGHDLSLQNIKYFKDNVPKLKEVSIGHALISESLYKGLKEVIKQYLKILS